MPNYRYGQGHAFRNYYHPTILVVGWEKNKSNFLGIANTAQSKGVNLKPQMEIHRD